MRIAAACLLALTAFSPSIRAAVVTYTDQTLWLAAVSGVNTIDFSGLTPSGASTNYTSTGLTLSSVHFSDSSFLYVADAAYFSPNYLGCLVACLQGLAGSGGGILATLPSGVRAVGVIDYQYQSTSSTVT